MPEVINSPAIILHRLPFASVIPLQQFSDSNVLHFGVDIDFHHGTGVRYIFVQNLHPCIMPVARIAPPGKKKKKKKHYDFGTSVTNDVPC